jgi:hypothetical protein
MSFYTGTQSEVLFAGPPAAYPAEGASTGSAFAAFTGATGNYQQPLFPGGFWQQGRTGQMASVEIYGTITGQSSATTLALVLGLVTSPNSIASIATLLTYPTLTVTSFSSAPFFLGAVILNRGSGYGTSSVATNLNTSGSYIVNSDTSATTTALNGAVAPTQLATTDFSVNQWLQLQGTFSTNNAGNNITVNTVIVRGEN